VYTELLTDIVDFDGDLLRNIKGIRISQDLFDDLGDNADDYTVAHAAESRDTVATDQRLLSRPFDYGTAITFPFLGANWQRTRFSDGSRYGVWYGSLDLETTIYESVYHWRRFVLASFSAEAADVVAERRVIKAKCRGILVSLLDKEIEWPALIDPDDYTFTNALGGYLHAQGQNGLLAKSARYNGTNGVIFKQSVLSDARDHCFLTYLFNPRANGAIRVEREQGVLLLNVS
jgi:hypothetical protein